MYVIVETFKDEILIQNLYCRKFILYKLLLAKEMFEVKIMTENDVA